MLFSASGLEVSRAGRLLAMLALSAVVLASLSMLTHDNDGDAVGSFAGFLRGGVADPTQPRFLSGAAIGDGGGYDVCLRDSLAFLGCRDFLHVFDVSSPAQPVKVGYYQTPWHAFRVTQDSGLIYVACYLAGVCVFETLPAGIAEQNRLNSVPVSVRVTPNPTRGAVNLLWTGSASLTSIRIRDAAGKLVMQQWDDDGNSRPLEVDFGRLPSGVYFAQIATHRWQRTVKVIKR